MPKINCIFCWKEYNLDLQMQWKRAKCNACKEVFEINFDVLENTWNKDFKYDKEEDVNIKPNKNSFIFLWNPIFIFLLILSIIVSFFSIIVWVIFYILSVLLFLFIRIIYKKEEYTITDRKIIYNFWTIFSDNSVEINLDKITQISCVLWFIQYSIFKTWTLIIKTAWSTTSKIKLKNINNAFELFEIIQTRMRKNWFHLEKDKLVQLAKPHWLWVFWEIAWQLLMGFFFIFVFIWNLIAELEDKDKVSLSNFSFDYASYVIYFLLFILIFIVFLLIINYLDLKRREYKVFTDTIYYTEWFLTKNISVLPMESVADTENVQSFWSKVFWLHDVVVSSEWSENRVYFKNMIDWETLMKNIKYLKDHIIMRESDSTVKDKNIDCLIWFKDKIEIPLDYNKEFKWEFKMSMLKSLIITLPFIFIPPAFFVLLVWQIIRVSFTSYNIEESSIEQKFEFLTNKHNIFSIEKITWIKIKESILDRILWTFSVTFWSIWSNLPITFSNIKKEDWLEKLIMSKVWIKLEEDAIDVPINFNLLNYLKSIIWLSIFIFILFLLIFIISLFVPEFWISWFFFFLIPFVIFFSILYIYFLFFYDKSRYIQKIHTHFLESISGIFFITKSYVLFRNIKWVKSTKYPLTDVWRLYINVAWEQVVKSNNKQTLSILSNSVSIHFVDKLFDFHDKLDFIFNDNLLDKTVVQKSSQDVWNSIIWLIIFYIVLLILFILISNNSLFLLIFILTIIFTFFIWFIIWFVKVISYEIQRNRVQKISWVIYVKKETILYKKFNFIEKNQWLINKIFKNGLVKIYTLWSGKVDMKIVNTKDYFKIYNLLKKD